MSQPYAAKPREHELFPPCCLLQQAGPVSAAVRDGCCTVLGKRDGDWVCSTSPGADLTMQEAWRAFTLRPWKTHNPFHCLGSAFFCSAALYISHQGDEGLAFT